MFGKKENIYIEFTEDYILYADKKDKKVYLVEGSSLEKLLKDHENKSIFLYDGSRDLDDEILIFSKQEKRYRKASLEKEVFKREDGDNRLVAYKALMGDLILFSSIKKSKVESYLKINPQIKLISSRTELILSSYCQEFKEDILVVTIYKNYSQLLILAGDDSSIFRLDIDSLDDRELLIYKLDEIFKEFPESQIMIFSDDLEVGKELSKKRALEFKKKEDLLWKFLNEVVK